MSVIKSHKKLHISINVSDDGEIQKLNKKYFNRDYPTDVLSFNINDELEDGTFYLGDIIVNKDQAERQMTEYGTDLEHEIAELVEHGVLHLLGIHHNDDDEKSVHGIEVH
jgi:probable rRNA maturation factor